MTHSMADAIALIRQDLAPSLVSDEAFGRIYRLAELLPPAYWGGFECHLSPGPNGVDFHQGYSRVEELETLIDSLGRADASIDRSPWRRLESFCAQWKKTSSPIHGQVDKVSVEFDVTSQLGLAGAPSVFLFLNPFILLKPKDSRFQNLVESFFSGLTGKEAAGEINEFVENLAFAAGGVKIVNVGAMISRKMGGLRLVLANLSPTKAATIVAHLCPERESARIEGLLADLKDRAGCFALNLDVLSSSISSRIGIECYPKQTLEAAKAWKPLLSHFCERGLCSKSQSDALIKWQGLTTPATCRVPWPEDLIAASLLKKPRQFTSILRFLNHVKVDFSPKRRIEAKAYLGFIHDWFEPNQTTSPGVRMGRRKKTT